MLNKDVVIIGGGPAGLTAGIYLSRAMFDVVLIEKMAHGGQIVLTDEIENYPGFPDGIKGQELAEKMVKQAKRFGTQLLFDEVTQIEKHKEGYLIRTWGEEILAKGIILASGAVPRKIGVEGEEKFTGRGVSYCATCDGPFFKDKVVTVIGGGDAAVEEGIYLTTHASKVFIMHRRDQLRASKLIQERAFSNEKIEIIWNALPEEIMGEKKVSAIKYKDKVSGEVKIHDTEGVFIFVGYTPASSFIDGEALGINMTENGYITTEKNGQTTAEGIFAAGDVVEKNLYQVATAVGDGAMAAFNIQKYLEEKNNE